MTFVVNALALIGGLTLLLAVVGGIFGWRIVRDLKHREFG